VDSKSSSRNDDALDHCPVWVCAAVLSGPPPSRRLHDTIAAELEGRHCPLVPGERLTCSVAYFMNGPPWGTLPAAVASLGMGWEVFSHGYASRVL